MDLSAHAGVGLNQFVLYTALKTYSSIGTHSFNGAAFDSLAWAIADAFDDWIGNPLDVVLAGVSTGTAGVGLIPERTSHLFMAPAIPLMTMGLRSAGLDGPLSDSLSTVVSVAIAHAVTQFGGYTGACPMVGVGTDASKVVFTNTASLTQGLISSMASHQMTGPANIRMANGLAIGLSALTLTVFGTGKVIGAPSPVPASGPSISKIG